MNTVHPEIESDGSTDALDKAVEPPMYRVVLHNDDYTTMEFVIEILAAVFRKTCGEAMRIMLNVHEQGVGVCGIYTFEIAETKVDTVHLLANESGFPLKCSMEKE
jgi:ATP-dependent Clp protease adaptor protein ClpS